MVPLLGDTVAQSLPTAVDRPLLTAPASTRVSARTDRAQRRRRMRFIFAWVAVAVGCTDPSGELGGERAAIYHGVRETAEPWVVAVSYLRPGTTRVRLCTGSVIAPGAVLTA